MFIAWYNTVKGGGQMPELSRFAGIIIKMIYKDNKQHNKPHIMENMKRP